MLCVVVVSVADDIGHEFLEDQVQRIHFGLGQLARSGQRHEERVKALELVDPVGECDVMHRMGLSPVGAYRWSLTRIGRRWYDKTQ